VTKPVLLAVDDDTQVLAAVRRDLRSRYRESYTIISATSGEEALATIRELKARGDALAVVISDQRMPGMHGTDLLAQSRETYPLARRVLRSSSDWLRRLREQRAPNERAAALPLRPFLVVIGHARRGKS